MEDTGDDQSIRNKNNEATYYYNCAHNNGIHQLTGISAAAGQLEEGEDVTHVMVVDAGITKG